MPAPITTAETLVNTTTTGDQQAPAVAVLADGGWVILWTGRASVAASTTPFGVFGQRYNSAGQPVGGEFQVNSVDPNQWEYSAAVAALPDGGWIVVWHATSPHLPGIGSTGSTLAYYQRYAADGSPDGGEVQVNAPAGYPAGLFPTVSVLSDGGWVITWHSRNALTDVDEDIYAQRYDAAGIAVGGEFQVNTTFTGVQVHPTIVALQDGGWIVAWQAAGQDGSASGIYARRYDSNGSPVGLEFRVNSTTAGDQGEPAIAALADGGWVVVWQSAGQDGSGYGIYAQRYNASGSTQGGEVRINTTVLHDQGYPMATALPDGGWAVSWISFDGGAVPTGGSGGLIYLQRYDAAGTAVGGETLVGASAEDHWFATSREIAALANGGLIATWGNWSDGSGHGIYARTFAPPANIINGTEGDDTLYGTPGDDVVNGQGGNDHLFGLQGNDVLNGGDGIDFLQGGPGTDAYDGGGGAFDQIVFSDIFATQGAVADLRTGAISNDGFGNAETMTNAEGLGSGTRFSDIFYGNDGVNPLVGGTGDYVYGFGGDDFVNIEGAPALIDGGDGQDAVNAFRQARLVDTNGDGIAEWENTTNGVHIDLSQGLIVDDGFGGSGMLVSIENIVGSAGDDTLIGSDAANFIMGSGGADLLVGLGGDDLLQGGDGNDLLRGDGFNNYNGPSGSDIVSGGAGDDIMWTSGGVDSYDGGDGFDRVSFVSFGATQGAVASLITQTISNDGFGNAETMVSIEALGAGTAFADHLTGDENANFLVGDRGDTLIGNGGDDDFQLNGAAALIDGGFGVDTITRFFGDVFGSIRPDSNGDGLAELEFATRGVHVDLSTHRIVDDGFGNSGTLVGIENVGGSGLADTLIGDGGVNVLTGYGGNDMLDGMEGDDILDGGDGDDLIIGGKGDDFLLGGGHDDLLTGGQGRDTFAFGDGSGDDHITDFEKKDLIVIDADGIDAFSDLTIVNVGGSAVISWGTGDSITLDGYKASKLSAADFDFGAPTTTASFALLEAGWLAGGAHDALIGSDNWTV